jgi:crotonobetainyl-CoA:carnitine CoA-transferase CaiB-like acyl-CoA transferase
VTAVRPLAGLTVAEVDSSLALAFCGRQFAALGARVTAYGERLPEVDNAVRDHLDADKVLRPGPAVAGDLSGVDLVLSTRPVEGLADSVVNVVITDQGRSGPRADWRADDVLAQAQAGLMALVGAPDGRPTAMGGHQIAHSAGVAAFSAALVALYARDHDGRGQVVETSLLETAAYIEWKGRVYHQAGNDLSRGDTSGPVVVRCSDGDFGLYYRPNDWSAVKAVLDTPGLDDPRFDTPAGRAANGPLVVAALETVTTGLTRDELYLRLQARGVPAGPVYSASDLLRSKQYLERDFLARHLAPGRPGITPAFPATFNGVRPSPSTTDRSPAPADETARPDLAELPHPTDLNRTPTP